LIVDSLGTGTGLGARPDSESEPEDSLDMRCRFLCSGGAAVLVGLGLSCSDSGSRVEDDGGGTDRGTIEDGAGGEGRIAEGGAGHDGAGVSAACDPSAALVARVDPTRMLADLNALVGFGERRSQAGQKKAADYLRTKLQALSGVTVRDQSYTYGGATYVNLEAEIAGSAAGGGAWVFAGAHYDSTSNDTTSAPGADDDASGTVAVLEAARALADCKPKRGVRLLFFSNEEEGTIGSTAYVKSITSTIAPSKLVGFLSLDMVGYGPASEDLDLVTRTAYSTLVDDVASPVTKWTSLKVKKQVLDACG
jgi:hypothetical protein